METKGPNPLATLRCRTNTAAARSWSELAQVVHDGFAVLDTDGRLVFVSDRFMSTLGKPDDLVGHAVAHLLPALADDDPRHLRSRIDTGSSVDFVQHVISSQHESHWYRVTVVPSDELGHGLSSVVFARDISAEARRFKELSEATTELTRVENERHRRIAREIHDGPVQLLAALVFRLGMTEDPGADELQHEVSETSSTLRTVIEELTPLIDRTDGSLLEQWITPMLTDTGIDVQVHDHRSTDRNLAEAQAAFVMLYQVVRAMRDPEIPRMITLHVSDDDGGERFHLTMPSAPPEELTGERAARFRAIVHHAQTLGGTLMHSLGDDNIRTLSMWIPKLTNQETRSRPTTLSGKRRHGVRNDISTLAPLSDAAWRRVVGAAPERMVEIDEEMHITFANTRMSNDIRMRNGIDVPTNDLIGRPITELSKLGRIESLDRINEHLLAGDFVHAQWHRSEGSGPPQLIQFAFSPRFFDDGRFKSLFVSANDRSDLRMLDEVHETALTDLTFARHQVIASSITQLAAPLGACERLIERIAAFEVASSEPEAFRTIRKALEAGLQSITTSSSVFTVPPLAVDELGAALQESLRTILDHRRLVVVDNTASPPPTEVFDPVFRISREAANNAVLHGDAETITITLSNTENGISFTIEDDGIGLDVGQLEHQPGHLGTRSMRARAVERGGTLSIGSPGNSGTRVSVWLPTDPGRRTSADGLDAGR